MKFKSIRENHLFRKAYRTGRHKSTPAMTVYVLKDKAAAYLRHKHPEGITVNRIGISASKKVGGAVQRNRAKRVVREAYRRIDKEIGIKKGWLIVISPHPECAVIKTDRAFSDLRFCLSSLKMLENKSDSGPQADTAGTEQDKQNEEK